MAKNDISTNKLSRFFAEHASSCLLDKVSLWPITLCTVYFTDFTSRLLYRMVSEKSIMTQLQLLYYKKTQLSALQFVTELSYLSYKTLQE